MEPNFWEPLIVRNMDVRILRERETENLNIVLRDREEMNLIFLELIIREWVFDPFKFRYHLWKLL